MVAGANCRIDIFRIDNDPDDIVGGAVITGSLVHQNVYANIQAEPQEQLLLQQGLETVRVFRMVVVPGTLDVRERDELEVSQPTDHVYYGERFRIRGVTYSSHNKRDPRNYMILDLSRSVRAHTRQ